MAAPNMHGKVVMVTGATDGIGKATAHALAALGPTLIVVGRNPTKIAATVAEIKARSGNQQIDSLQADFAELAQVRQLAQTFKARYDRLDVLVNNAGIIFSQRGTTVDGYERTFAINHLAPFLLTNLLLDVIVASAPARIVNVSSNGHTLNGIDFTDLQATRKYNSMRAYAQSKLGNVMFTYELARRLAGTGVTVNALHPGGVATNMGLDQTGRLERSMAFVLQTFGLTPENGAKTSIYLASAPEVAAVTGKYFSRRKPVRSSKASYDVAAQQRLWQISAELTGIPAEITPAVSTSAAARYTAAQASIQRNEEGMLFTNEAPSPDRVKRLDEMNDLLDMGRFPLPIYVGATGNILLTIVLTYLLQGRYSQRYVLLLWAGGIISTNVLPVILLRTQLDQDTYYPPIEEMDFFADQHKFASWVYAIASANMLIWIVLAWTLFSYRRSAGALLSMLLLAFVCTFFPAWVRLFLPSR